MPPSKRVLLYRFSLSLIYLGLFVLIIVSPYNLVPISTNQWQSINFKYNQFEFSLYKKKPSRMRVLRGEPPRGVEPPTYSLRMRCSTN